MQTCQRFCSKPPQNSHYIKFMLLIMYLMKHDYTIFVRANTVLCNCSIRILDKYYKKNNKTNSRNLLLGWLLNGLYWVFYSCNCIVGRCTLHTELPVCLLPWLQSHGLPTVKSHHLTFELKYIYIYILVL